MSLKYLKKLEPILNKVGKKHNIPLEEAKYIFDRFFRSFRDAMKDPRIPKVKLPLFGFFTPKVKKINKSLKASIAYYKKSDIISREYINARIQRVWGIKQRLIKELNKEITWKDWRSKEVKEKYKKLVKNETEMLLPNQV